MSIHPSVVDAKRSSDPTPIIEAERWFARLKALDCSAAERMEFQRWRATPEHAAAYAVTEKLWESFGQLAGRPDLEQLSQQILADTAEPPRHDLRRYRLTVAAAILVCLVGGGIFLATQQRAAPIAIYATEPGERSTITLPDGSQLNLNSATQLDVQLDAESRSLTLRRGEALFTVSHDARRPFTVTAGDGQVTALGTRFLVRNERERITVTLIEGRVAVDRRKVNQHAELEPGDQVRFTEVAPEMTRRTVDPQVVSSWTTGRLRFRSTPLAEALDEVNRYSQTQVRIADSDLAGIPISGTFEIGDTSSVVSALEGLFSIEAAPERHGEILLRRR